MSTTMSILVGIVGGLVVLVMLRGLYVMVYEPHDGTTEQQARDNVNGLKTRLKRLLPGGNG